jgi:rubrerythrin
MTLIIVNDIATDHEGYLEALESELFWICKYCGENEKPRCPQCVREDGKNVTDELVED